MRPVIVRQLGRRTVDKHDRTWLMSASLLNRLGGTSGRLAPVPDDLRGEVMLPIRRVLANVVTPDLRWVLVAWTKGQCGSKQVVASYQPATSAGEG